MGGLELEDQVGIWRKYGDRQLKLRRGGVWKPNMAETS